MAVTVPRPSRYTGMSPARAGTATTDTTRPPVRWGPPLPARERTTTITRTSTISAAATAIRRRRRRRDAAGSASTPGSAPTVEGATGVSTVIVVYALRSLPHGDGIARR